MDLDPPNQFDVIAIAWPWKHQRNRVNFLWAAAKGAGARHICPGVTVEFEYRFKSCDFESHIGPENESPAYRPKVAV
jgi:hypothetical protein